MNLNVQFWIAAAGAIGALASAIAAGIYTWGTFRVPRRIDQQVAEREKANREAALKLDCLRRVAGYRAMPHRREWFDALNEVPVIFNKSAPVMTTFLTFHARVVANGHRDEDLTALIRAMMDDLGLDHSGLTEDFLLRPLR